MITSAKLGKSFHNKQTDKRKNFITANPEIQPTRVIMLGPSLQEQGGMGAVSNLIIESATPEIQFQHISTWNGPNLTKLESLQVFCLAIWQLIGLLLQQKVDLLHLHLSERGSAWRNSGLILIALLFNKPVILHAHGAEFHTFHARLNPIFRKFLNWILQKPTYLIVLSESWRKFYISHCHIPAQKVVVLHNPVDFPQQLPTKNQDEQFKLLFLGKINQRKGIYDLLKAIALVKAELSHKIKLIIAGSGEINETLNLAQELGIEEKIDFCGWVNREQRNQLLAQVDLFLLPSYNEGLPMALLEAMSWAIPVITTPVGGIGEVIFHSETGWLVEPGNSQQLKTAIECLLENLDLRDKISQAARNKVAAFSIQKYSISLSKLYQDALKICKN
ncbi:glycosyl transferase group 1 [Stanieria cyanosphaera PCC 7437]|uniref:Glycosyl transferase group 1 n=1 Tax=Stanieria cyanosphaera (strain ATCC 29371 / PCC 7437) TaxID=111780 RepID=K9XUR7_STAC7|nr:glycosyltransferase family 4 protein [Stanieria cyanosphaera]AFZ35412.1 glycosyl transferase group 1 [Stanieria cyanosphaera PCC 7437]